MSGRIGWAPTNKAVDAALGVTILPGNPEQSMRFALNAAWAVDSEAVIDAAISARLKALMTDGGEIFGVDAYKLYKALCPGVFK